MAKTQKVIGLMSGTSLDGVDAALIETDGESVAAFGPWATYSYSDSQRDVLRAGIAAAASLRKGETLPEAVRSAESLVTEAHIAAVKRFLADNALGGVSLIGFHGQTVLHRTEQRFTLQLGDGAKLARETGMDVVFDFRSADVAAGGQGAPFAPLYHRALTAKIKKPGKALSVLNIGGVANVTYLGADGAILAFDTGPGNALLDDWCLKHTGRAVDKDGALAKSGRVDEAALKRMLDNPFFGKAPPKSLDRQDFTAAAEQGLSAADGAATLTVFTAASIARAREHMEKAPSRWIVCGGGRHNPTLMGELRARLGVPVDACESHGWRGDAIEAEAFAFLAVRSLRGEPLSLPTTTGVPKPMTGGRLMRHA